MQWTADVSVGAWLRERIDHPWRGTMHDVAPRGFAAYARVFHPAARERPVGRDWPAEGDAAAWEAFLDSRPEVDTEQVSWEQTAAAFGTVMHELAQWQRLVRADDPHGSENSPRDPEGWRYDDPPQGQLEPTTLAVLARVLATHTTTPDAGTIALWPGWGGLTGGMGYGPSRTFFGMGFPGGAAASDGVDSDDDAELRHAAFLSHSVKDPFNNPFQQATWQPGILSDEISRGPRLELPGREFVLFRGGVAELADPAWVLDAPWRDRVAEEHGFAPSAESPGIVWPDDHAWVMVSEIDYDSTIVAGDSALIRALLRTDGLEVRQLREGADLGWDADEVNRP